MTVEYRLVSGPHVGVPVEYDQSVVDRVDEFCNSLRVERNCSAHTIRAYKVDLLDYARWVYRKKIDAFTVTHRQLRQYLGDLDAAQYSRTTINRRLCALRGFFRWLNVTGYIDGDPAAALLGPKQAKSLPHSIKPSDMVKILSVYGKRDEERNQREQSPCDMRNQALLEILYACGVRISEASGLLLENVDLDGGFIKVFGKGSKERIIPVHDLAIFSMRSYAIVGRPRLLKDRECEYFFVSTRGNQMGDDSIRKMFKETLRKAGLDETLSPHDMRHTFATDLLAGGADLRSVQEMLGHVSLSTTQLYTHVTPARLKAAHAQAHPRS